MLDFINKAMSSLFGSKSERDLKDVKPLVAKINEEYAKLQSLSHDALRDKTKEFQATISAYLKEINANIDELKANADNDPAMDADDKEKIYNEVDKLIKERDTKLEEVLNQILPQAFAVVKETARRFKDNTSICVKATPKDIELSASKAKMET
jgi:preprotein translocase subunit SecA